jgi:hypothetical protein
MCRSIKTLRGVTPASDAEIEAAARQFVRKISGFREPSSANAEAFEAAVGEITGSSARLLKRLPARKTPPRPRVNAARLPR